MQEDDPARARSFERQCSSITDTINLGEFEQQILLVILLLGDNA
jgi:hypothetical protein